MTPCKHCGTRLLFSARMSGTGHCGPCRRATRFNLRGWLLKQWHRFTLGRTTRGLCTWGDGLPGTASALAFTLSGVALEAFPVGVAWEVVQRRATDLAPGQVRIVLETCE